MNPFSYDVVVADPPWDFELHSPAGQGKSAHAHYDCMTLAQLRGLEIEGVPVAHLARGNAIMLMWTCGWAMATGVAQSLMKDWGFNPCSEIVWRKTTPSGKVRMGPGYRVRTMHEPILLGTNNSVQMHKAFPSCFDGVAREHSRKPDEFYEMVRAKTPRLFRCDLFSAGHIHEGFDGWGVSHKEAA